MEQLCESLPVYGIAGEWVHTESFGGELHPQATAVTADEEIREALRAQEASGVNTGCRVALADAGREILYRPGDGSWLDQLQRQGAEVAGGCRAGSCGSCMTRILKGRVRMRAGGTQTSPDGWVLPCVAEPDGDVTLQL